MQKQKYVIKYVIRLHDDPCDPSVISQIFQTHSSEQNSVEKEQGRYALLYSMVRQFHVFESICLLKTNVSDIWIQSIS